MSILLATTILALGGLGLYMYKSSEEEQKEEEQKEENDEYNEDGIFGTYSFFDWGNKTDNDDNNDSDINEDTLVKYEEEYKPRKKGGKTQRNRRTSGTSKRRYN